MGSKSKRSAKLFVRKATKNDLDTCLDLVNAARVFMRAHGNDAQWGDGYPGMADLRDDLDSGSLYVCCDTEASEPDSPLACFALLPGPDPTYDAIEDGAWPNDEPYLVFHRLAVGVAGRGVGTFCLSWIADQAKNVRGDTHELNLPMQATLAKCGFQRCGIIHLADGSPRISYQHIRQ